MEREQYIHQLNSVGITYNILQDYYNIQCIVRGIDTIDDYPSFRSMFDSWVSTFGMQRDEIINSIKLTVLEFYNKMFGAIAIYNKQGELLQWL